MQLSLLTPATEYTVQWYGVIRQLRMIDAGGLLGEWLHWSNDGETWRICHKQTFDELARAEKDRMVLL